MPKTSSASKPRRSVRAVPLVVKERSTRVRTLVGRYRRQDPRSLVDFASEMAGAEPMAQVELEREGVPAGVVASLAQAMAVPRLRIFKMMDLPRATMEKKISDNEVLTGVANRRALSLLRLLAHAREILKDSTSPEAEHFDAARWLGRWIETPQPALGGKKPADLLDTEIGAGMVDRTLGALRSGAYLVAHPRLPVATNAPSRRLHAAGVSVFRVATETRAYPADDLSGRSAAAEPGRWNRKGEPVVYAATSVSLATLETAAHVNPAGLPLNRFLVEIVFPTKTWSHRETLDVSAIGPAWKAIPAGTASERAGSEWLRSLRSVILLVPSVIVPEESCVLINPTHPDARSIRAIVRRRMEYDMLFR